MATVTRTFELSAEAAAELDRRAQAAKCNPSEFLDMLFLDDELRAEDFSPSQWGAIQQGMREADEGIFVPQEQTQALFGKVPRDSVKPVDWTPRPTRVYGTSLLTTRNTAEPPESV